MSVPSLRRRSLLRIALCGPFLARVDGVAAMAPAGRVLNAGPEDYRRQLQSLRPCDTLQLTAGEYRNGLPVHGLAGTADAPITIEGPRGGGAVFVGRAGRNTVSLVDSAHIVIRDLTLDGRNLPVDAVKAEGHARFAHHVTLQRLRIVGHGLDQSLVGISTQCPAWGWRILENTIIAAGTGMYLGHSDGHAPFWDGLIAGNRIVDPIGYGAQIKHQRARPPLEGAPLGPLVTVLRGNVIMKRKSATTPERARPNLLLGHFPLDGAGSEDRYLVYGNLLFDNPSEALLQAEGRVALYNNLLVNPHGDALRLIAHSDRPRDVAVFHNSVVARGTGIELAPAQEGDVRIVLRNLVFADRNPGLPDEPANQLAPYARAEPALVRPLAAPESLDLAPRGVTLLDLPDLPPQLRALPDADRDFLGRRRDRRDVGACSSHRPFARPCR